MVKLYDRQIVNLNDGDNTNELMSTVAAYLHKHGLIKCEDGCGVSECSHATANFEIRIVAHKK